MKQQITPSQPDYARTIGDLVDPRSALSSAALIQLVQQSIQLNQQATGQATPDGMGLLAEMLRTMKRRNCNYNIFPFSIPANSIFQILPQNEERRGLIVSLTGGNQLAILLQQTQTTITDLTSQPNEFQQYVDRSIKIISGSTPLTYDFQNPPTNPLTIVNTNGGDITGVVLEGS